MAVRGVVLDTGPLGILVHPRIRPEVAQWFEAILERGCFVVIPEIADYELRRALIKIRAMPSISRLDELENDLEYLPITTAAMRQAAEFWAAARQAGHPTAADPALDGDMILAAQSTLAFGAGDDVVVATDNVGHLSRFVPAMSWTEIT